MHIMCAYQEHKYLYFVIFFILYFTKATFREAFQKNFSFFFCFALYFFVQSVSFLTFCNNVMGNSNRQFFLPKIN